MKYLLFFINIFIYSLCLNSFSIKAQRPEIIPYINFLKEQKTHPVDYIFELFEKYDIIILGERDHRDLYQYELIEKIISDKRFIENVGNVFMEFGMHNRTEWVNQILKNEYATHDEFEKELRYLYREYEFFGIWEKYNAWSFLSTIYRLNTKLTASQKINLFPTDVSFDWNNCRSREDWLAFNESFSLHNRFYRDSIMGNNMVAEYKKILMDDKKNRKKALVIYNSPHSYQSYFAENNKKIRSAASYIFKEFPEKTANVMINWMIIKNNTKYNFIADGKWDAAFWALNNPSVGFDFKNSPFGTDKFDHYLPPLTDVKYQDIYTGFVFYGGVTSWNLTAGIPGIVDDEFKQEHLRRNKILNDNASFETEKVYFNTVRTSSIYSDMPLRKIKRNNEKWLK